MMNYEIQLNADQSADLFTKIRDALLDLPIKQETLNNAGITIILFISQEFSILYDEVMPILGIYPLTAKLYLYKILCIKDKGEALSLFNDNKKQFIDSLSECEAESIYIYEPSLITSLQEMQDNYE